MNGELTAMYDTFAWMMTSQKQLSQPDLSTNLSVRTKKNNPYNDTAKYSTKCIYCADMVHKYPRCEACQDKPEIIKAQLYVFGTPPY